MESSRDIKIMDFPQDSQITDFSWALPVYSTMCLTNLLHNTTVCTTLCMYLFLWRPTYTSSNGGRPWIMHISMNSYTTATHQTYPMKNIMDCYQGL